jgi:hypothetical protein
MSLAVGVGATPMSVPAGLRGYGSHAAANVFREVVDLLPTFVDNAWRALDRLQAATQDAHRRPPTRPEHVEMDLAVACFTAATQDVPWPNATIVLDARRAQEAHTVLSKALGVARSRAEAALGQAHRRVGGRPGAGAPSQSGGLIWKSKIVHSARGAEPPPWDGGAGGPLHFALSQDIRLMCVTADQLDEPPFQPVGINFAGVRV